ncbi:hypothetical protein GCM10010191_17020 [Actinomadura vinacea]|uniref:Uncharacterized protein n=1 Tax=Actinomadura vinacea TaxID=115336 RepID=A0ABP5VQ57_9ACTN
MEADLHRERAGSAGDLRVDDLRLVVLAGRLGRAVPDLHPVPPDEQARPAPGARGRAPNDLADLLEQPRVQQPKPPWRPFTRPTFPAPRRIPRLDLDPGLTAPAALDERIAGMEAVRDELRSALREAQGIRNAHPGVEASGSTRARYLAGEAKPKASLTGQIAKRCRARPSTVRVRAARRVPWAGIEINTAQPGKAGVGRPWPASGTTKSAPACAVPGGVATAAVVM